MNFSLKNAHNRRLAAAALATFTLLNPTLIFGVYNLGTLVLAGLTLLLWVHYFAHKAQAKCHSKHLHYLLSPFPTHHD